MRSRRNATPRSARSRPDGAAPRAKVQSEAAREMIPAAGQARRAETVGLKKRSGTRRRVIGDDRGPGTPLVNAIPRTADVIGDATSGAGSLGLMSASVKPLPVHRSIQLKTAQTWSPLQAFGASHRRRHPRRPRCQQAATRLFHEPRGHLPGPGGKHADDRAAAIARCCSR